MNNKKLCPVCENGYLTELQEQTDTGLLVYSVCNHCLSEQADAEQVSRNLKNSTSSRHIKNSK